MHITDRIFGSHTISSPVLLELINSKPMQRLKGIGQLGQPVEYDPRDFNYSRYDHSIGVMLLLKILGASEEEQIAGLLHDVSHTAFSHTIDLVLGSAKNEDFQDSQHKKYIMKTEIPTILKRHGYDATRIYDYHHFTLLERDLPALCADRVDYSLRESELSVTIAILPHLASHEGEIVFTDLSAAKVFAKRYMHLQKTSWGGVEPNIRAQLFARGLRYALEKEFITLDDFWEDDAFVLSKLKKANDPYITKVFAFIQQLSFDSFKGNYEIIQKKFRFIDPTILVESKSHTLSEIDGEYRDLLAQAKKENKDGIKIPILV